MSRSDNTPWTGQRHLDRCWETRSLPRGTGRWLRRKWQKQQRQAQQAALHQHTEPEPARPRHSVHWNYW